MNEALRAALLSTPSPIFSSKLKTLFINVK